MDKHLPGLIIFGIAGITLICWVVGQVRRAWIRHQLRQLDPAAALVMPKVAYELGAEMVLGMQKELKARRKALDRELRAELQKGHASDPHGPATIPEYLPSSPARRPEAVTSAAQTPGLCPDYGCYCQKAWHVGVKQYGGACFL
jgi:hypothetical protein